MNICIWGTEEKARDFAGNMINSNLTCIVDGNCKKWGKVFRGLTIKSIDDVDFSLVDLIAICSDAYEEIIEEIRRVSEDVDIVIMAPGYYQSIKEFDELSLGRYLKNEYVDSFKKRINNCLLLRYGELILDHIDAIKLDKENYPVSAYDEPPKAEEILIDKIFSKLVDKCNLTVIHKNAFNFKNRLNSSDSFVNITRYGISTDAFPWLCLVDDLVHKGIMNSDCAFDVGANNGVVSTFLSGRFKKVHSFEPSKACKALADYNIKLNECQNITWNETAVGNTADDHMYYDYGGDGGCNSLIMQNREFSDSYSVRTILLDDYCRRNEIKHIDLMKIDVEGYESYVIAGCATLIKEKRVSFICLEVSPGLVKNHADDAKMLSFLIENGFEFYDVKMKPLSYEDIESITVHQDIIGICREAGNNYKR